MLAANCVIQKTKMSRPEELVLTTLKAVLDLFLDGKYEEAAIKCSFLLRKKTNLDQSLAASVQKLLLICYLEQEEYETVINWVDQNNKLSEIGTYAKYRSKDYNAVSKEASKDSILERHLLAQSYFHLKQTNPALKTYQELLSECDKDDTDSRMELMHNAIAVIAANASIPFVPLVEEDHQKWVDQADDFLQENVGNHELAFNLGTLQILCGSVDRGWLKKAETKCNDDGDIPAIEHNIAWSHHFWQKEGSAECDYSVVDTEPTSLPFILANINQSLLDDKGKLPLQPNQKWNTLQIRMYWYNRAITQYKTNKLAESQESSQALKKTLGSGESTNAKKKRGATTKVSIDDMWWEARADVVLAYAQDSQSKKTPATERLESRLQFLKQQQQSYTIDHAIAYVSLHLFSIQNATRRPAAAEVVTVLQSLPESIQSHQAVRATINALDDSLSKTKKSPLEQADMFFGQGKYEDAANLYAANLGDVENCDEDELANHLRHVQVLAMIGKHDECAALWSKIRRGMDDAADTQSRLDGEALEKQPLPRSSTTKSIDKHLEVGLNESKPKRSQKNIRRQRARRREKYLKELEAKGEYNPDRPVKPNPERWIPKHARSSNRRGGRRGGGGGPNRSAQGGGSQADAQRLDAAARRAGIVPANLGPSTANMKVSNGSRKAGRRR